MIGEDFFTDLIDFTCQIKVLPKILSFLFKFKDPVSYMYVT